MNKSKQISDSVIVMALLTLSGGFMDAYSYMCRDHVFANAQTGNILLFGVNISTGNVFAALRYFVPVMSFAAGIALSEIVRHCFNNRKHIHWRQITVLVEGIILMFVAFIPQSNNLLANSLTSFACGAQVQSFRTVNGIGVATTMCIGNLRFGIESICEFGFSKNSKYALNSLLVFSVILIFVSGAILGNLFVTLIREKAILVSSALLFITFAVMLFNHDDR